MIHTKLLRENPDLLREAIAKKKFKCDLNFILSLDERRRESLLKSEHLRTKQKEANAEMAALPKGSPEFLEKAKAMKELAAEFKSLESISKQAEDEWLNHVLTIPNIPHDSVPIGHSDADNKEVFKWGDLASVSPFAKPHYDIPWIDRAVDFQRGVKVAGAGFPFYVGNMARLVRALIAFYLEEAYQKGYEEVLPPILVNAKSATATGQLPDKEGMMYFAQEDGLYMIPTAEVPVTNFYRDEIIEEKDLPIYRCAYTPCFRREAGSWGKDVRGLNRLHQFDKVELVKWVHPDRSYDELEKLRLDAEELLQKLELPYRVLLICTGDIGFCHAKQYDLEVWAGGQQRWLEVSSCSNFTDFQARRAGIRFRPHGGGKVEVLHTLNGSGLAIPRVLAALLENNLQEDGRVRIPSALQPYFKSSFICGELDSKSI